MPTPRLKTNCTLSNITVVKYLYLYVQMCDRRNLIDHKRYGFLQNIIKQKQIQT